MDKEQDTPQGGAKGTVADADVQIQATYKSLQSIMQQGMDYSPFQDILARTVVLLPHNGDEKTQEKLRKHYAKFPSRGIDDMCKLMDRMPGYSKTAQTGGNTSNTLILNLGELSLSQKRKLLKEKLNKLGISDISEIDVLKTVKGEEVEVKDEEQVPRETVGENRIKDA